MTLRTDLVEKGAGAKARQLLGEGRFAIGLTVGLTVALVIWLFASLQSPNLDSIPLHELVPTVGALVVALASLFVSYLVLSENRLLRQAGTDPVVLVHLGKRSDAPMLTTVDIRNVGAGAALEVQIEVLSGAPNVESRRVVTDLTKLTHPIRAIPQNHAVSYNFGAGHELLGGSENDPLEPIRLRVTYRDIEGSLYSNEQVLDVRELRSQQAHTPNETKVAHSLESIAKSLATIAKN